MVAPVDPVKSLHEIIRVAKFEAAMMAILDGYLVGTLGIMKATWWYSQQEFLTDRWHFVLPQFQHGAVDKLLKAEARAIAQDAQLKFIDQGRLRQIRDGTYLRVQSKAFSPEE